MRIYPYRPFPHLRRDLLVAEALAEEGPCAYLLYRLLPDDEAVFALHGGDVAFNVIGIDVQSQLPFRHERRERRDHKEYAGDDHGLPRRPLLDHVSVYQKYADRGDNGEGACP